MLKEPRLIGHDPQAPPRQSSKKMDVYGAKICVDRLPAYIIPRKVRGEKGKASMPFSSSATCQYYVRTYLPLPMHIRIPIFISHQSPLIQ